MGRYQLLLAGEFLVFSWACFGLVLGILIPENRQNRIFGAEKHKPYVRGPNDPKVPSYPVILVPGDGGSRIDANLTGKTDVPHYTCSKYTKDYFDLWLNLESFIPFAVDCWADNMRLAFNETTMMSENIPGVETRIPGFGGTESVEWLDPSKASQGNYFAPIVEALTAWGYKRGKNVLGAPFDWRRAPHELNDFFLMLKTLIEMTYRYNSNTKVVILGHSMGNPIMNFFYQNYVSQEWKEKFIKTHISLAGAWGGAMQIVKLFASGYNMDYYRIILPPSSLRPMQRSFTSSAFLFPHKDLWASNEIFASGPDRNYSSANIKQFFDDIKYPTGWLQYQKAATALSLDPPGVEVYCIYGSHVNTPEILTWTKGYFPDYQPTVLYGNGDGTVNIRSLEACKAWNEDNNAGKSVHFQDLTGADHMSILKDPRTIKAIQDILYGNSTL